MQRVDIRCIDAQPSMTAAIRLCQQLSGLDDKKIVGKQGIVADVAQWSRITRSGQHYFPQDKLNAFMDLCHNEAPLIWLARSRGYELTPLETEMERRLRLEREKTDELERENMLLKKLLTGEGGVKKAYRTLIVSQAFTVACVVNLSGWCPLQAQSKRTHGTMFKQAELTA
ncbi:hypothetical protein [Burkholderia sp. b13]|uniref:hypothetical protein n=1 Tax=Burkholderia sp. b13 TaxID=1761774 RepID=UPI000977171F|nr:hypothetical protein [Burkholderia sp. b13]